MHGALVLAEGTVQPLGLDRALPRGTCASVRHRAWPIPGGGRSYGWRTFNLTGGPPNVLDELSDEPDVRRVVEVHAGHCYIESNEPATVHRNEQAVSSKDGDLTTPK